MKNKTLIVILLVTLSIEGFSQIESPPDTLIRSRHSFFFELLGSSALYSVNYDYLFLNSPFFKMTGTIGFCPLPTHFTPQLNILLGEKNGFLELGVGYSNDFGIKNFLSDPFIAYRIGFRYQPIDGGFFLRLAYTPLLSASGNSNYNDFTNWFGLSIGGTFGYKK